MRRLIALICALILVTGVACDDPEPADDDSEAATQNESDGDEVDESDETAEDGDHTEGDHELADDLAPGESGHYGEPFAIDEDPEPLASAIARLNDGEERLDEVKVSSSIEHVCEKRGCWMALDDDDVDIPVRVHMDDYAFFVPRNVAGADTIVEGSIEHTVISEEDARHYAEHVVDQTGVDPDEIEGEQPMYEMTATGIAVEVPES